ncbi:MAG: TspO/MBR family protein [Planctomycetota bacterium]
MSLPVPAEGDVRQGGQYGSLAMTSAISAALLGMGGWLTFLGLGRWYVELEFPPYQPPPWVFTPVWTVVLTLLAWSTWLVCRRVGHPGVGLALGLYGAQCVLNVGWSLLFFTVERPDVAMWELLALDVTLALMIAAYARVSKVAAVMLVPYFAWLMMSTAINAWIVAENPSFGA